MLVVRGVGKVDAALGGLESAGGGDEAPVVVTPMPVDAPPAAGAVDLGLPVVGRLDAALPDAKVPADTTLPVCGADRDGGADPDGDVHADAASPTMMTVTPHRLPRRMVSRRNLGPEPAGSPAPRGGGDG